MRPFKRTIGYALAVFAVTIVLAAGGCKYETGPPDYSTGFHGGTNARG